MDYFSCKRLVDKAEKKNPYEAETAGWRGYEDAILNLQKLIEDYHNDELDQRYLYDVYGLERLVINDYHIKLKHEEYDGWFDWYHTTGTIIANRDGGSTNIGKSKDVEKVAKIITKHVLQ